MSSVHPSGSGRPQPVKGLCASLIVLASLACDRAPEPSAPSPPPEEPQVPGNWLGTHVVMLGTGTPNADPDRSGPCVAIVVNGTPYLVDAGPGVVRRAAAARLKGVEALAVENLKRVFITHLHTDHTLGLPDLILTPWVLERREPLEAFGPPGLASMTEHLLAAYEEDVRVRLGGSEPANPDGYKVNVHEIEPGLVYSDDNVRVTAFPVRHGSWTFAFGYRFETPSRTVVISGDTAPCPELIEHARGADVLIHEVYSQAAFERRPPQWQRYHAASHTSAPELADIAARVRPRLLILYHQLYWGTSDADLLGEVRDRYKGKVISAVDLGIY